MDLQISKNVMFSKELTDPILARRWHWTGVQMAVALVHMAYVVLFSKCIEKHLDHVQRGLKVLSKSSLSLQVKKCSFFHECIEYFRHVKQPCILDILPKATATVCKSQHPTNFIDFEPFLNLCNLSRRILPNFTPLVGLWYFELGNYPTLNSGRLNETDIESF